MPGMLVGSPLLRVFLQTAPLTVAVAIIALAHIRKWFDDFAQLLFFSAVALPASVLFASVVGNLGSLPSFASINPVTFPTKALALYWRHYGASLLLSSLILGVFLAWAITKRLPVKLS